MKKILLISLIIFCQNAFCKVISLDCNLRNGDNKEWLAKLSMDTDNQMGSATKLNRSKEWTVASGKLFSDGGYYWFTYNSASGYSERYQIDRNNLSLIYIGIFSGIQTKSIGECKIIEKDQPKI